MIIRATQPPAASPVYPTREELADVADLYLATEGDSLWPEVRRTGTGALIAGAVGMAIGGVFGAEAALAGVIPGGLIGVATVRPTGGSAPPLPPPSDVNDVLLKGLFAATCAAAGSFTARFGLLAGLGVALGGALLATGVHWVFGDERHNEAQRRLEALDQRVGDALLVHRMAQEGGSGGVESRQDNVVVGGILVRRKK